MSTDTSTPSPRPKNRRAEIEQLIAFREKHGLTWGQLSARSGIPVGTLTSWQQKLRKEAEKRQVSPRRFVEVAPAPAATAPDLTLETAHGLRVHVPAAFDGDALKRLLSTLGIPC